MSRISGGYRAVFSAGQGRRQTAYGWDLSRKYSGDRFRKNHGRTGSKMSVCKNIGARVKTPAYASRGRSGEEREIDVGLLNS